MDQAITVLRAEHRWLQELLDEFAQDAELLPGAGPERLEGPSAKPGRSALELTFGSREERGPMHRTEAELLTDLRLSQFLVRVQEPRTEQVPPTTARFPASCPARLQPDR